MYISSLYILYVFQSTYKKIASVLKIYSVLVTYRANSKLSGTSVKGTGRWGRAAQIGRKIVVSKGGE